MGKCRAGTRTNGSQGSHQTLGGAELGSFLVFSCPLVHDLSISVFQWPSLGLLQVTFPDYLIWAKTQLCFNAALVEFPFSLLLKGMQIHGTVIPIYHLGLPQDPQS